MNGILLGSFHPGDSWLHRLGAAPKLLGLLLAGVATIALTGPATAVAGLLVGTCVLASTGTPWRGLVAGLRLVLLATALLAAWQAWQSGWPRAVEVSADLLSLVLLATAVTSATPTDETIDAITRGLQPLRRIGVRPERVALAVSLMLRALPATWSIAIDTREAALARGLERDPRARLTPLVVRVVAQARATGEALHARGVLDDDG